MPRRPIPSRQARIGPSIEVSGVLLVVASMAHYLLYTHKLKAYSDPARWFLFGKNFASQFGEQPLPYGFPLLLAGAIELVGPFWAFLVNIPVLAALAALLYGFARAQLAVGPSRLAAQAPLCGALTLLLFVWIDPKLLRLLVNPYRDGLSYVLVLLSALMLLRSRGGAERPLLWMAGSGAALALAASTRATSVLMLLPLALYGVVSRRDAAGRTLWKPAAVFAVAFGVAAAPYLVQNLLLSGSPLIPAQAGPSLEKGGVAPGVSLSHLSVTLPDLLKHLRLHYGWTVLALGAVGLGAALRHRLWVTLFLTVPAALVYAGFYGAYKYVVDRYAFVLDLFVLPIAGVGGAALLQLALSALREERLRRLAARGLLVVLLAAAFVLCLPTGGRHRFRVPDAQRLHADVTALVSADATFIGDRPLSEIFRVFVSNRSRTLKIPYAPRTHAMLDKVAGWERESGDLYAIWNAPKTRDLLRMGFDLTPVRTFASRDYGLEKLLDTDAFHLQRLTPWSQHSAEARVAPEREGAQVLAVDVGSLSRYPRSRAELYWNGRLLDPRPSDGINFYAVRFADDATPVPLQLRSDGPVPAHLETRLGYPVQMVFKGDRGVRHISVLSRDFFAMGKPDFPGLRRSGSISIPTAGSDGAVFGVETRVGVAFTTADSADLDVTARGRPVYQGRFRPQPSEGGRPPPFWLATLSFLLGENEISGDRTAIDFLIRTPDDSPVLLWVRTLDVFRHELTEELHVELGGDRDGLFIQRGFPEDPEDLPAEDRPGRWSQQGELRLLTAPSRDRARLRVTYVPETPAPRPLPKPGFALNGVPLEGGERRAEPLDGDEGLRRVTQAFELEPSRLGSPVNVLSFSSPVWLKVESLSLERIPGAG